MVWSIRRLMGVNGTGGSGVFRDPHRGEALFGDQQIHQPPADEVFDLATDERDADLDGDLELLPGTAAGLCVGWLAATRPLIPSPIGTESVEREQFRIVSSPSRCQDRH